MKQWHDKNEVHTNVTAVDTVNFPKCGTLNIVKTTIRIKLEQFGITMQKFAHSM